MADNPPEPKGPLPPLPSSGTVGLPKSPTTQLPSVRKGGPAKIVVMLSSVAKSPPAGTQQLPTVTGPRVSAPTPGAITSPPKVAPITSSQLAKGPPPLPPKQVAPSAPLNQPTRLSTTTFVKLPPKTANPTFMTLSGKPATPPPAEAKATSPASPPAATPAPIEKAAAPVSKAAPVATPPPVNKPVATPPPVEKAKEVPPISKAAPQPAPVEKSKEAAPVSAPAAIPPPAEKPKETPAVSKPLVTPPPLPLKRPDPALSRKTGAHLIPPIKLNELSTEDDSAADSIFAPADKSTPAPKPAGWKNLEPGELPRPAGGLKDLEVFARSQKIEPKPEPAPSVKPVAKEPQSSLIVPPSRPTPVTVTGPMLPPPLPLAPAHPVQHAPPMLEKKPEPHAEKLPQPHLTPEPAKAETLAPLPPPAVHKAPALVQPDPVAAKPLQPPVSLAKTAGDWLKKTAPLVLSSNSPKTTALPPVIEAKPALKPPVLPKRFVAKEPGLEPIPPVIAPATPPATKSPAVIEAKEAPAAKAAPPALPKSDAPVSPAKLPEPIVPATVVTPSLPPKLPEKESAPVTEKTKVETPQSAVAPIEAKPAPSTPPPASSAGTASPPKLPEKETVSEKAILAATAAAAVPVIAAVAATKLPEKPIPIPADKVQPTPAATTLDARKATSPLITKLPEKDKAEQSVSKTPSPAIPAQTKAPLPLTRAERAKKRRLVEVIIFWVVLMPAAVGGLVFACLHFGRDTRVEGQVIPPPGMTLNNEVWIVTDFTSYASGIAEDLAAERTPIQQEIQERQEHVQRVQADVASREERLRLIQEEIDASKSEISNVVKQSRDATQQIWDGEGAQIDGEYQSHLNDLKKAIADRAKSLNLKYEPDPDYQSPEVWANAYRLALYEVPPGVDGLKEHQWLADQMKQWRDFQKSLDDRKETLREKAAQLKLAPAPKIADLNSKIEDLQQRQDSTTSEEIPLKAELQQAQSDLAVAQEADANLDDKYYKELYSLPDGSIVNHLRIPIQTNGRFTWIEDNAFVAGETEHSYWFFSRATRPDGRQYWSLHPFSIPQNKTVVMTFEPSSFQSTKAILRPNLSPDEQEQ